MYHCLLHSWIIKSKQAKYAKDWSFIENLKLIQTCHYLLDLIKETLKLKIIRQNECYIHTPFQNLNLGKPYDGWEQCCCVKPLRRSFLFYVRYEMSHAIIRYTPFFFQWYIFSEVIFVMRVKRYYRSRSLLFWRFLLNEFCLKPILWFDYIFIKTGIVMHITLYVGIEVCIKDSNMACCLDRQLTIPNSIYYVAWIWFVHVFVNEIV